MISRQLDLEGAFSYIVMVLCIIPTKDDIWERKDFRLQAFCKQPANLGVIAYSICSRVAKRSKFLSIKSCKPLWLFHTFPFPVPQYAPASKSSQEQFFRKSSRLRDRYAIYLLALQPYTSMATTFTRIVLFFEPASRIQKRVQMGQDSK